MVAVLNPQTGHQQIQINKQDAPDATFGNAPPEDLEESLWMHVRWFDHFDESMQFARNQSERDRDFYDNRQWTEQEIQALENRGQSATVYNRIKPVIEFYQGLEHSTRSLPKALPRTPQDIETSTAASQALQYVSQNACFSEKRSRAFKDMLNEGTCGLELVWNPERRQIEIERYAWDRLWWDPHARETDFSDARFKGVMVWMDYDEAVRKWPDRTDVLEFTFMDLSEYTQTWEDTPRRWHDRKRKRVRIVRIYYMVGGDWWWATFAKGGYLDYPRPTPYVNEFNRRLCPLEMQSAYSDREGYRYGKVRDMIGPQMDINKRLSKSLQLLSTRQVITERGAVDNVDKTRRDLTHPDALVEINPGKRFDITDSPRLADGHVALMSLAREMIDNAAPSAQAIPRTSPYASGVAIAQNQQASAVETSPVLDGLFEMELRIYRTMWDMIKQFWTGERWIRITDEQDNVQFVAFNQPQLNVDPTTGETSIRVNNNLARMDVDIILDRTPVNLNIQAEQFRTLADLWRANPQAIPYDLLIEMSQLPNDMKDNILRRLRGQTPEAQQQAQRQQMIEQMALEQDMQQRRAETAKTAAEADKATQAAEKLEAETLQILSGDANRQ